MSSYFSIIIHLSCVEGSLWSAQSFIPSFIPRLMEKLSILTTCTEAALCCVASSKQSTWRSHLPWVEYTHNHMTSSTTLLSLFASPVCYQPLLSPDALCFLCTGYPSFPCPPAEASNGVRDAWWTVKGMAWLLQPGQTLQLCIIWRLHTFWCHYFSFISEKSGVVWWSKLKPLKLVLCINSCRNKKKKHGLWLCFKI